MSRRAIEPFCWRIGTLGVIAAHEGDNFFSFNKHGIELGIMANKTYAGTPRVYAPALRTVIARHEKRFTLQVRSGSYAMGQIHAALFSNSVLYGLVGVIQAAVLSAEPPTAVRLTLTGAREYSMTAVPDQKTGVTHSQIYSVSVPTPQADFAWKVTAEFGEGKKELKMPAVGNQTVVVV